jgi:hypothetical protein
MPKGSIGDLDRWHWKRLAAPCLQLHCNVYARYSSGDQRMGVLMDHDEELQAVRQELDELAALRRLNPFKPLDHIRYLDLCQRERLLLGSGRDGGLAKREPSDSA